MANKCESLGAAKALYSVHASLLLHPIVRVSGPIDLAIISLAVQYFLFPLERDLEYLLDVLGTLYDTSGTLGYCSASIRNT